MASNVVRIGGYHYGRPPTIPGSPFLDLCAANARTTFAWRLRQKQLPTSMR